MKLIVFDKLGRLFHDKPVWKMKPEYLVIDTILNQKPELVELIEKYVCANTPKNNLGRKDLPTVEQILRAGIYKEMTRITYEELEFHQFDSELCRAFLKLGSKAFSDSMYQKYISMIPADVLKTIMEEINKIAIEMGYEDCSDIRTDSTVVETNIHKPTNNSLVFDCINTSARLLSKIYKPGSEEFKEINEKLRKAKRNYYQINNIDLKGVARADKKDKKEEIMKSLFQNSLEMLALIHQEIKEVIGKNAISCLGKRDKNQIKKLDNHIDTIYKNAYQLQIEGQKVENSEKIFSIYEEHTDILVKGIRDILFGHKINLAGGRSNMFLYVGIEDGNPRDTELFEKPIVEIKKIYEKQINTMVTDGGYASLNNQQIAKDQGIKNIIFTKINSGLKNITSDEGVIETKIKHWRAGAEAVISNLKRRFDLRRVVYRGKAMFDAKVMWSVLCYNIRVLTGHILTTMYG